jgi:hypothetical protein
MMPPTHSCGTKYKSRHFSFCGPTVMGKVKFPQEPELTHRRCPRNRDRASPRNARLRHGGEYLANARRAGLAVSKRRRRWRKDGRLALDRRRTPAVNTQRQGYLA